MNSTEIPGTVFRAKQAPCGVEGGCYVFVPDFYFLPSEDADPKETDFRTFDEGTFQISRWARLNAIANGISQTVSLLPDLENLLADEAIDWPDFQTFVAALRKALDESA